ncbi:MAG: glycosyltransferase family 4 protein [Chloroflexi bacterium]|nr:glycosyltransferase family 4 protein [Chloroflexota bacterium]
MDSQAKDKILEIDRDKTILILSSQYLPNTGGVETSLKALATALTHQNVRVKLLTLRPLAVDRAWKPFESQGLFSVIRIWVPKFGSFWTRIGLHPKIQFVYHAVPLMIAGLIFLTLRGKKVGLINAHGFVPGIVGAGLKFFFRKPLVISLHSVIHLVYPDLERGNKIALLLIRFALDHADHIKVASDAGFDELIRLGIDAHHVSRLVYPIDLDTYSPRVHSNFRTGSDFDARFTVLFVGRITEQKGIKIIVSLARRFSHMHFVIAGTGPLDHYVHEQTKELQNLVFLGFIPDTELPRLYNSANTLFVPSQEPEGIPMVTMEALACGVPLVTTNLGGLSQYRNCSAAIVSDSSESALADALLKMQARNSLSADKLRADAREYAIKHFSVHSFENLIGVRLRSRGEVSLDKNE